MRKRTVVWTAKKAAPAIARAAPAVVRAAAPAVARAAGTLLAPEVGLALAAGGALYSTVKGLAGMYHSTPSEYTKITAQGEETYHPPHSEASVKPLGLPHKVTHRHPAQPPPVAPQPVAKPAVSQAQPTVSQAPQPVAQAPAPVSQAKSPMAPRSQPPAPVSQSPAPIAQATPQAIPQATPKDPRRIDTATVGIKPFRIGAKPYNLAQWEANTHEIAEKMMSGHS